MRFTFSRYSYQSLFIVLSTSSERYPLARTVSYLQVLVVIQKAHELQNSTNNPYPLMAFSKPLSHFFLRYFAHQTRKPQSQSRLLTTTCTRRSDALQVVRPHIAGGLKF